MTAGSPNTIGPYTITREVGRGDMGVVYLVTEAPDLGPHGIKYPIVQSSCTNKPEQRSKIGIMEMDAIERQRCHN